MKKKHQWSFFNIDDTITTAIKNGYKNLILRFIIFVLHVKEIKS